jgi:hypothetical protein
LVVLRRKRGSAAELPLLYISAVGVATFFGNLMSMSSVGDFSRVAVDLRLPMAVRYGGTAIGTLVVAGVQFWLGRRLVHWIHPHSIRDGLVNSAVSLILPCPNCGKPARVGSPGSRFDAVSSGGNRIKELRKATT